MFCGACGKEIAEDSAFCRFCGAPQQPDRAEPPAATAPPVPVAPVISGAPTPPTSKEAVGLAKIVGIIAAIVLVLGIIGSLGRTSTPSIDNTVAGMDTMSDNLEATADNLAMAADATSQTTDAAEVPSDPWSYSTDEDKVRGGTTYYASVGSTNSIRQDAPYDSDTTMRLTVRRSPGSGLNIILTISSGQLMCPSYTGCSGTIRFDDGPARTIRFSGTDDNSSETIFVNDEKSFLSGLRKAKKLIVEKTVYEAGSPQFEFDVHGLKWDH